MLKLWIDVSTTVLVTRGLHQRSCVAVHAGIRTLPKCRNQLPAGSWWAMAPPPSRATSYTDHCTQQQTPKVYQVSRYLKLISPHPTPPGVSQDRWNCYQQQSPKWLDHQHQLQEHLPNRRDSRVTAVGMKGCSSSFLCHAFYSNVARTIN